MSPPFLASYSVTPTFCVSSFTASMNLFIILYPVYPLSKPSQDASLTFLRTAKPELKYSFLISLSWLNILQVWWLQIFARSCITKHLQAVEVEFSKMCRDPAKEFLKEMTSVINIAVSLTTKLQLSAYQESVPESCGAKRCTPQN